MTRPRLRRGAVVVLAYAALYVCLLVVLHVRENLGLAEPLLILVVAGLGFTALALWTTRDLAAPTTIVRRPAAECFLLAVYLFPIVGFFTWGVPAIHRLGESPAFAAAAMLAAKLLLFVALPLVVWRSGCGYRLVELTGPSLIPDRGAPWLAIVTMSAVLIVFQLLFGNAMGALRVANASSVQVALGLPLAFAWLFLEVGIVEEFFFRALLQSRLAALLRSETAGVVLASLIFGLAHAPGLYLRPEATGEALGAAPSMLFAVGYSVLLVSVTGFFLGALWVRTRNLGAVAAIHAAGDLLPNLADFLRTWHLR